MKKEVKLIDFLKTGVFGGVKIDDSLETVIEKLGQPDGAVVKVGRGIHYSMYEFMFLDNKLESIQNDRYDINYPELMEFENESILVDPGFFKADRIKYKSEIEEELLKLNIKFETIEYWGGKGIRTEGGVVIDFHDEVWLEKENDWVQIENEAAYELLGIRYFPKFK